MPDVRIPFGGSYNTRTEKTNTLSAASGIVGLGIVGTMIVGKPVQSTDKDQRYINCYTESIVNSFTGTKTLYTVKRPGFAVLNTPAAGSIGTAIMVWTGQGAGTKVMSCFGGTNSTLYDGTTSEGTITGKATRITETMVSTTPTLVISSTDSTAWYYDESVGTVTKITDGDFPGNAGNTLAGTFAHMDGYAFIMDTHCHIWNSDLNSVTAWTAANFLSANSYPDGGIGIIRFKDKIVAFGTESTQFYYNAGNPTGSPLSRIESMTIRYGCVNADAIGFVEDAIYWVGSSPQGGIHVLQYSGAGLKKISSPFIESILILAGAANISLTTLEVFGMTMVIVNASTLTFVYQVEENAWHEWNTPVNTRLWYKCAGSSSGSTQVVYAISNISTGGKVYTINPSSVAYTDDSLAFTARIQTSKFGKGHRRIFWDELTLIGDKQSEASPTQISYSDDDYQTWTYLSTVDLSDNVPSVNRCLSAYRRAWAITNAANTPMRLEAMEATTVMGNV